MEDLQRLTWENAIAVKLQLSSDSITSPVRPNPIYVLVSRQGFLSSLGAQAWPHFQHVLPSLPGQQNRQLAWFDYKHLPLRGNLPIGVLFDLCSSGEAYGSSIPWELTVHYTAQPEALASWQNGLPQHVQYFHSLKEACFISRGPDGSAAVMKMTGPAQDTLWSAVESAETSRYLEILSSLKMVPTSRQEGVSAALPCRLIVRTSTGSLLDLWDTTFMTSRPVPATRPNGAWTTLDDMLSDLLPDLRFAASGSPDHDKVAQAVANASKVSHGSGSSHEGATTHPLADAEASGSAPVVSHNEDSESVASAAENASSVMDSVLAACDAGLDKPTASAPIAGNNCDAVVCGVLPPLETPLAWLHAQLHAADYFLYVVVRKRIEPKTMLRS